MNLSTWLILTYVRISCWHLNKIVTVNVVFRRMRVLHDKKHQTWTIYGTGHSQANKIRVYKLHGNSSVSIVSTHINHTAPKGLAHWSSRNNLNCNIKSSCLLSSAGQSCNNIIHILTYICTIHWLIDYAPVILIASVRVGVNVCMEKQLKQWWKVWCFT